MPLDLNHVAAHLAPFEAGSGMAAQRRAFSAIRHTKLVGNCKPVRAAVKLSYL
jgi:hypothetical protein